MYENEVRTPREIKRFVNELRYKAIRFRRPQATVPVVGKTGAETSDSSSLQEPTLILIAILERLKKETKMEILWKLSRGWPACINPPSLSTSSNLASRATRTGSDIVRFSPTNKDAHASPIWARLGHKRNFTM